MPDFTLTKQIDAPVEAVWEVLDDFGDIQRWNPGVAKSHLTTAGDVGHGTERRCEFSPMGAVHERIAHHAPGEQLTVEIYEAFKLPMKRATADFSLAPKNGGTEITLRYRYEPNLLGRLMSGPLEKQMRKGMAGLLEGLEAESVRMGAA